MKMKLAALTLLAAAGGLAFGWRFARARFYGWPQIAAVCAGRARRVEARNALSSVSAFCGRGSTQTTVKSSSRDVKKSWCGASRRPSTDVPECPPRRCPPLSSR